MKRTFILKCVTGLTAGLLLAESRVTQGAVIGTDNFDYTNGPLLAQNGGTGWDRGGSGKTSWTTLFGTGATVASGAAGTFNGGSLRNYGTLNGNNDQAIKATGVVYFGVDMNFSPAAVANERYAGVSSYDFGDERIKFGKTWNSLNFGLDGQGTAATNISIVANTTYRIVGSIQWDTAGGNGRLKMWVNPNVADLDTALGTGALTSADLVVNYGTTGNWNTGVRLASGGSNNNAPVAYDNLIVATTFAEAAAIPEPTAVALLTLGSMLTLARRRRRA